jgi:NADH-quinone oxidoreductase subunit M
MLLAILALYYNSTDANGLHSFDMLVLKDGHTLVHGTAAWLTFIALFVGFAIKVPIFPFHTWLPDAHVEAPTAISMILAGVLLKMGTYGILRVNYSMFPDLVVNKTWIYFLAILAAINIIYGALVAMAQKDLKKLVAYSSVSHMGYCLLGIAAINVIGFQGCMLQMWNHGIITGALFLLVGVLYDRAHIREIDAFGGIAKQVPVYTTIMCIAVFASLGLPGLAGFVSEFLCFLGGFQMDMIQVIVGISVLGIVLTAAYLLRTVQKIFLGELNPRWSDLKEINTRELICAVPLLFFMFLFGVYPKPVLDLMESTLTLIVKGIGG